MNMNMNFPPAVAAASVTLEFGDSDYTTTTNTNSDDKELEVAVKAVHFASLLSYKLQQLLLPLTVAGKFISPPVISLSYSF